MLTKEDVKDFVKESIDDISEEAESSEDYDDLSFQRVDDWWNTSVYEGRMSDYPEVPESYREIELLIDSGTILMAAVEERWDIEDDSGIWEGLSPLAAISSQAFFTLRNTILRGEPKYLQE